MADRRFSLLNHEHSVEGLTGLSDPNVDALLFWDDVAGAAEWATEIADSFLSSNVPLLDANNTFTGTALFTADAADKFSIQRVSGQYIDFNGTASGNQIVSKSLTGNTKPLILRATTNEAGDAGTTEPSIQLRGRGNTTILFASPDEVQIDATTLDFNGTLDVDGGAHDISGQRLRGTLSSDVQFTTPLFVVIDSIEPKVRLQVGGTPRAYVSYIEADGEMQIDSDGGIALRGNNTDRLLMAADGTLTFVGDNQELRFGAGNDLAIYSDGTSARFKVDAAIAHHRFFNGGAELFRLEQGRALSWNPIYILEQAAHTTPVSAGFGQLWVKNTTPCQLWFTDDAGTDHQIV